MLVKAKLQILKKWKQELSWKRPFRVSQCKCTYENESNLSNILTKISTGKSNMFSVRLVEAAATAFFTPADPPAPLFCLPLVSFGCFSSCMTPKLSTAGLNRRVWLRLWGNNFRALNWQPYDDRGHRCSNQLFRPPKMSL